MVQSQLTATSTFQLGLQAPISTPDLFLRKPPRVYFYSYLQTSTGSLAAESPGRGWRPKGLGGERPHRDPHGTRRPGGPPLRFTSVSGQLFWEKKLSGLNAFDIAEELVKTMDLPKGLQGVGPGCTDETLLSAIASALHTSTMPITGQLSAAVEKNPGVWLNTTQPLCKAFMVTDEDIRKQEELVQQVRKRLEEALMADMLAHVEELARDGEAPLDKACTEDDDEEDEEDEEEEPDPDPEMEHV
uniref:Methyl-CpG binding domain protein 3 n=1 Tax=Piliocolobus tephrosceles TaxID=591936 RepID=A0A8C9IPT6_9PRIM